jgi:anti-sigma factor RsiW
MDCDRVRSLLDAYVDGELDLTTSLEIERHIDDCSDCPTLLQNRRVMRQAMQSEGLSFKAPPGLGAKVRAAKILAPTRPPRRARWQEALRGHPWLSIAGAALLGILLTAGVFLGILLPDRGASSLAEQVLASHLRSLQVDHLNDVASSDQHTVKPWFDGKLDFAPPVVDLAQEGFPLMGGRLDYLDGRAVTALVYGRQLHIINLFIWPTSGADSAAETTTLQGYHLIRWQHSGAAYWAVSDLEVSELQTFVGLIQAKTAGT